MGAFAALLGVSITGTGVDRKVTGLAVGDCCLVVVATDDSCSPWPIGKSGDFGLSPALLSSTMDPASQLPLMQGLRRKLAPGDTLFLMSDAIAAWSLREAEEGRRPWALLRDFTPGDGDQFCEWARGVRKAGQMRNDDVTLAIVDPE